MGPWERHNVKEFNRGSSVLNVSFSMGHLMMTSFDYKNQNALRQAIVFVIFFCEESLVRDTNLHNKAK